MQSISKARYSRGLRYNAGALMDKLLFYTKVSNALMKKIHRRLLMRKHRKVALDLDWTVLEQSNSFLYVFLTKDTEWLVKKDSIFWKVRRALKDKPWSIRDKETINILERQLGKAFPKVEPMEDGYRIKFHKGLIALSSASVKTKKEMKPKIYSAFERLHDVGLVHGNAAAKNILIDPKKGTFIIIDWDDLCQDSRLIGYEQKMLDSMFQ